MAEPTPSTPVGDTAPTPSSTEATTPQPRPNKPRGPPLNQIYSQPAPIRTYPLPTFYPGNPLSLLHLVYTWVKQTIFPPAAEPSVIHQGIWNPETRSVHVIDPAAIRALWEQGFYGKGSLSRSEPNWLKREKIRRGAEGDVSEQRTAARREERRQVKWERARLEQEALEKTRLEEALLAASSTNILDATTTDAAPQTTETQAHVETEPASKNGALAEGSSSQPSTDSVHEPSVPATSQLFGDATRSNSDFHLEIDLPAAPGFPSEGSVLRAPFTSILEIPVLSASVSETVKVTAVSEEPSVQEPPVTQTSPEEALEEVVEEALEEAAEEIIQEAVEESAPETVVEETSRELDSAAETPVETLDEIIEEAIEEAAQETAQEVVQETLREAVEETIQDVVGESLEDAIEESLEEAIPEGLDEEAREVIKEALHETVEQTIHEAIDETIEETVQEIVEELPLFRAPVGPLELLSLPNSVHIPRLDQSTLDVSEETQPQDDDTETTPIDEPVEVSIGISATLDLTPAEESSEPVVGHRAPVGPLELLSLPNSLPSLVAKTAAALETVRDEISEVLEEIVEAVPVAEPVTEESTAEETAVEENSEDRITEEPLLVTERAAEVSPGQTQQHRAPVGPLELLSLPNSLAVLHLQTQPASILTGVTEDRIEAVSEAPTAEAPVSESVPTALSISKSPVGPLELLALPNSLSLLRNNSSSGSQLDGVVAERVVALTTEVVEASAEFASMDKPEPSIEDETGSVVAGSDISEEDSHAIQTNGHANGTAESQPSTPLKRTHDDVEDQSVKRRKAAAEKQPHTPQSLKRRKSVRFSSPARTLFEGRVNPTVHEAIVVEQEEEEVVLEEGKMVLTEAVIEESTEEAESSPVEAAPIPTETATATATTTDETSTPQIENKEHLQLSTEEAFFLSFALGSLSVLDPATNKPIPQDELLRLFRSNSYFPPRSDQDFQPNDPFLVHYAVYHHFRSLGWVPRHGIKFGVDWMIYQRGPVFDHAEFGAMVMPSYSDPWWKSQGKQAEKKSWSWLHGVNRVLSHVLKSLVLVYVDVPSPATFDAAMADGGIAKALGCYGVREFMVRRWSSNRNR